MSDGTIFITAKADLSQAESQINNFSKRAQITLTNLNQVVQDLPFGFIGIQNNLPGLIQSFSTLAKEEKGVSGALKAIGTALIGPVGLTFAFSAAISGITTLVQSYGSLGLALTDIFGLQLKATDIQNKYNLSLESSVGNLAAESFSIKSLASIMQNSNLTLEQRNGAYQMLNKQYPGLLANFDKEKLISGELNTELAKRILLFTKQIELNGKQQALQKLIAKAAEEQFALEGKLATGGYFDQLGLQLKGFLQGDFSVLSAATAIKNTFSKTGQETEMYGSKLKKVQEELSGVNFEINKLIDSQKKSSSITGNISKGKKGRAGLFDFLVTEVDKGLIPISKLQGKLDNLLQPKISRFRLDTPILENSLQPQIDALTEFVKKSEQARADLQSFFFDPVNALFTNFFETGKITIQSFGDVLLSQIKRIVASELTKKLLKLLSSLIPGIGSAGAVSSMLGSIGTGALGDFLGFGGTANFGGVQGGGMGMSGQVNLVLRGTDLVGSINRTNSQISRVG